MAGGLVGSAAGQRYYAENAILWERVRKCNDPSGWFANPAEIAFSRLTPPVGSLVLRRALPYSSGLSFLFL